MKQDRYKEIFFRHIAQTSPAPLGLEIERASGIELIDRSGKTYMDLISGISVSNLGHCHPAVVKAVQDQAERFMHLMVYGEYILEPQTQLADLLSSVLPSALDNYYFVNSGSEAVEGAIKLAKKYSGRYEVIAFRNAYHGSTLGSLSLMGNENLKSAFRPLMPDVRHLEFNNEKELVQITDKTACVVIEPVQGEAGIQPADLSFIQTLRRRCDQTGALLVLDEIQTGIGRTGKMFCFEHYQIIPDILLLAKAFGGGMPLGVFIAPKKIMQSLAENPALGHITTFGGHPVCCAAAHAALSVLIDKNLIGTVDAKERMFRELLGKHPSVKEFRSKGLMMALDLGDAEVVKNTISGCLQKGLILDWFLFNDTSIRLAPPLIISESEIEKACHIITECL